MSPKSGWGGGREDWQKKGLVRLGQIKYSFPIPKIYLWLEREESVNDSVREKQSLAASTIANLEETIIGIKIIVFYGIMILSLSNKIIQLFYHNLNCFNILMRYPTF